MRKGIIISAIAPHGIASLAPLAYHARPHLLKMLSSCARSWHQNNGENGALINGGWQRPYHIINSIMSCFYKHGVNVYIKHDK